MCGDEKKQCKDKSQGKQSCRIFALLINEPVESDNRIDHRKRKNDERCESELEHSVRSQISACINISYIEDLGSREEHYSDDRHAAYEDIDNIALGKELLDGICIYFLLADHFRLVILCSSLFLSLNGRNVSVILSAEYDDHKDDADYYVSSPQDKELIERRTVPYSA